MLAFTDTPVNQGAPLTGADNNRDAGGKLHFSSWNNRATTAWTGSWHLELNSIWCRLKTGPTTSE